MPFGLVGRRPERPAVDNVAHFRHGAWHRAVARWDKGAASLHERVRCVSSHSRDTSATVPGTGRWAAREPYAWTPRGRTIAYVIRHVSDRRWSVYDRRGRRIAKTSGPDGPVAGFAWLALRDCRSYAASASTTSGACCCSASTSRRRRGIANAAAAPARTMAAPIHNAGTIPSTNDGPDA